MAIDYTALAAELTAGHPLTGAYNVDNQLAADQLNAVNRPNVRAARDVFEYFLSRQHRTNQVADTTYTTLLGRLVDVTRSVVGGDPFGRGVGNELNMQQLHGCISLLEWLRRADSSVETTDANLRLGYVNGAGVISPGQVTEIEALSQNQISRAQELGLGHIDSQDVAAARA